MDKLGIDPRYLTTPIGAAVGLLIARKTIKPEDRTILNQGLGAALGAGAGFVGGSVMRGNSPLLIPYGSEQARTDRLQRYILNKLPTGTPSRAALRLGQTLGDGLLPSASKKPYWFNFPGNMTNSANRSSGTRVANKNMIKHRIQVMEAAVSAPGLSPRRTKAITGALDNNKKLYKSMNKKIRADWVFGGFQASVLSATNKLMFDVPSRAWNAAAGKFNKHTGLGSPGE